MDISTRYHYPAGADKSAEQPDRISFRLENECFKGSRIDKTYSIQALQNTLAKQLREELKRQLEHEQRLERDRQQKLKLRHDFEPLVENKMWPKRSRGMRHHFRPWVSQNGS